MNMKQAFTGMIAAAAGLGFAASASALSVAGIPLGNGGATFSNTTLWETEVDTPLDTLQGIGIIDNLTVGESVFQNGDGGLSLVYTVEYTLDTVTPSAPGSATFFFTGGEVNVYVIDEIAPLASSISALGGDFDSAEATLIGSGPLFLSLEGNAAPFLGAGTLRSFVTEFPEFDFNGTGYLDVTGGLAADVFDTNSQLSGTDFRFTSSFNDDVSNPSFLPLQAGAEFSGVANTVIPEPMTAGLGLIALGGAGLAALRRTR